MTAKQQTVDVQQPDPNFRSREWDWHVWEQIGSGKERWIGFFRDTETALGWVRQQPGNYIVNNVPPMSSNQRVQQVRSGFPWDRDKKTRQARSTPRTAPQKRQSGVSTTAPIRRAQRAADTSETRAMKQDAKVMFDQHKADEAAELAQDAQG